MNTSKMKNTIVLKNLPSNIIEEAIVFLKTNKRVNALENADESKSAKKLIGINCSKDYIMQEAESVITNYLSEIEQAKKIKIKNIEKIQIKYNRLKRLSQIMTAIIIIYTIIIIAVI